jgi:hypothetical protein
MVADIEQEYCSYVCNVWQETPDIAKLNFELHPEPERTYDAISLASSQFLQEKLKTLEAEETLLCADYDSKKYTASTDPMSGSFS